jgi:hypothetical protein
MYNSSSGSKLSSTRWETSYFGGYSKVLWDHPEIHVSYKINYVTPKDTDVKLDYYLKEKLIKIFLLKVFQNNANKAHRTHLFFNKHRLQITEKSVFGGLYKNKVLEIGKYNIQDCLSHIINNNDELAPLFSEFFDFISSTSFSIDIDDDKNKKDDNGGDSNILNNASAVFKNVTDDIKLRKSLFGSSSSSSIEYDDERFDELKNNAIFKNVDKQNQPIIYDKTCVNQSEHLLKMLDISFDPKKDVISNLKSGKLNQSKIGEIPAGNSNVYFKIEENQSTKPFSICILGDESGSMDSCYKAPSQNHLFKVLYRAFSQILPSDKLFIYGHSGMESPEIRIYHDPYNQNFEYTVGNQLNNEYYENYDGPVIELIYEKVRSHTNDNILFILISDGQPSGQRYGGFKAVRDMKRVIEKCKRDNFVTVGIGIQDDTVKDIYHYNTVISDVDKLVQSVSVLLNKVVKTEFQQ